MPWPEKHLPPRKGAKDKTLHVAESVSWITKQKIAHRIWMGLVGRINGRKKIAGAWEGKTCDTVVVK